MKPCASIRERRNLIWAGPYEFMADGVLRNIEQAKVWYRKAADLGHAQAKKDYERLVK